MPEYDEAIMKEFGGSTVSARPTSSVVRRQRIIGEAVHNMCAPLTAVKSQ
jgi:hypothetical protein